MERLVRSPGRGGSRLIDIKNAAGRSPLAEAEMIEWAEGASWLAQMMSLDGQPGITEGREEQTAVDFDQMHDVEVEIEDADGQVARMTLGAS
jgi:hypothetical protein